MVCTPQDHAASDQRFRHRGFDRSETGKTLVDDPLESVLAIGSGDLHRKCACIPQLFALFAAADFLCGKFCTSVGDCQSLSAVHCTETPEDHASSFASLDDRGRRISGSDGTF